MYYFRLIAFVVCSSYAQGADLRVASAFSSHMVVQEGEPIPIWGWAAADEDVRVRWDDGDVLTTRAVGGEWMVELPARTCGEDAFSAHTIQIESGSEALEIEDVLVGEVWLASGQSNMEWPLVMSNAFEATQALAPILGLRVFTAARISAPERMDNVEGSWKTFTAENCGSFSAVGTYFGLELLRALNKPIGVLHTSWGGSRIEAWMSPERLMEHAEGRSQLQLDPATFPPNHKPSFLSNGMIAPFEGLPLAGCIWYQGESNAEDPSAYGRLFPAMIQDWRARFGQLALPFYFVQLANFTPQAGSDWPGLREAQRKTVELVPNTGMAVIFDVGDEHDIHPRNKKTVGSRLARLALSQTYGHDLMGAAPFPVAAAILPEGVCSIQFEEVRSDLLPVNALLELGGFELAGDDGIFVAASAAVSGNTVLVTWTQASVPSQVRYCWMDDPAGVNRLQVEGLPVSPFHLQITGLPAEGPVDPK